MSDKKDIDEFTGVETTGHEWDGIKELNNPLPRWWLWTYYLTIIFAIGYVIYYPAIPLIHSATKGVGGYSSRADLDANLENIKASRTHLVEKIEQIELGEIVDDPALFRFSVSAGRSVFKVYCSQCHGSGAQGAPGYPNLNDDDWLWGGRIEDIYLSIAHGIRYEEDDDTRFSEMPAFGRDGLLEESEISALAHYVLALSGQENDAQRAQEGEMLYQEQCSACHGETGLGDREQGAPNLTDVIWFYGGEHGELVEQIANPKHGVMPGWKSRLGDATVKQLAVYVHSLGGGE